MATKQNTREWDKANAHATEVHADVSEPRDQPLRHTPGPWRWWTSNSFLRLSSDATRKDGDVLYGYVMRDGVASVQVKEADATLIALAPELVEALRELIYAHDAGEVTRDDWVKARQVLAKVQQS